MEKYDIAVIGGGPAGCFAAIRAGQRRKKVILVERNQKLGQKLLLTGKGRCNLTNTASMDVFIDKFGKQGKFLRSAFYDFSNQELMGFFRARGLKLKEERQGRVFPETDKASSVVKVLEKALQKNQVDLCLDCRITGFTVANNSFKLKLNGGEHIQVRKLVLATGGSSYHSTGSSGDGYKLARKLGHHITPLLPGLVPLRTKETWVKDLQGLTLKNISIVFKWDKKKKISSEVGELLFTHFGVSGPLVLDLSHKVSPLLDEHKEIALNIDLKPGLNPAQTERRLLREFEQHGSGKIKNILKTMLPQSLIEIFLDLAEIDPDKEVSQISREERKRMCDLLKKFPLTVCGTLPLDQAMVTSGGISLKEVNPRTMESRLIPGLYFAGEIIDGCASSGGYNLQQAFSTGFLAGENAAFELKA